MSPLTLQTIEETATAREELIRGTTAQSYRQNREPEPAPVRLRSDVLEEKRWAIILAGGDGSRLRSLTRFISGDERPKQFCKIFGQHTLLEQTQHIVARSIPLEHTVIALTETHKKFYEAIPSTTLSPRMVQPCNRGTAPPIILSLLHIANQCPDALVAVVPSDHYYSDGAAITAALESAFKIARAHPESVVLLGAEPKGAEVEYGWIQLGSATGKNVFRVRSFEEKPHRQDAERLMSSGALWNTFVMVGSSMAMIWMSFVGLPALVNKLDDSLPLWDDHQNLRVPAPLYEEIATTDYSRQVLTPNAHRLLVLRLQQLEWQDLGHPDRVVSAVRSSSQDRPAWFHAWEAGRMAPRDPVFQS